ncbi:putative uncharacterized protein [Firmicutes bacterium CAG:882]|nr:putative uncharacterized protein [Firmicutes bacterium CAG:882]
MINLHLEKLYRYPRIMEPMWIAVPVKKGQLSGASDVSVYDGTEKLPVQTKVTARYDDGSVRFLFTRFMGNLPGNSAKDFSLYLDEKDRREYVEDSAVQECASDAGQLVVTQNADGFTVDTGTLCFRVKNFSENLFDTLMCGRQLYEREQFLGPYLCDGMGTKYNVTIDRWRVVEEGNVCTILAATGSNDTEFGGCEESNHYRFEIRVTAYAGKPWLEISYRLFNTSESPLKIKSLVFSVMSGNGMEQDITLADMNDASYIDSTGCGDISEAIENENALVYRTRGTKELLHIEELAPAQGVRTCAGASNYKTDFVIGRDGTQVNKAAYDKALLMEGNEHMAEVLYGTFFADRTDADGGVCATIFQAQQNYPKAVKADKDGVYVMLVPEGFNDVVMQSGMAREQRFMLHFHEADEHIAELDNRSLIYQMPDRPIIAPYVYKNSGAVPDVFADKVNADIDMLLISKADARARSFGMLNWGDTIDWNYTKQGRGGGAAVWVNNEYDFPHACALMYMRMGIRRYLDFCMVHASHWMDVDVCHYSADPLKIGGLTEHTKGHVINGVMVPSHEWVEGFLDYYHLTGDERGLETAIGIGENIMKLLDTPAYAVAGESNARETGWALRALTALYIETGDEKYKAKCDRIVGYFEKWYDDYGCFAAPYTDNTLIHVGFMISVAVGSLMRYYRINKTDELKELIMLAVDDILDNCMLDCGLFYYKELPSLARLGNNTLLLEAMAAGYELTGDKRYLEAGLATMRRALMEPHKYVGGDKQIIGDALVVAGDSTKNFAQSFYPIAYYYKCLVEAGMEEHVHI